MLTKQQIDAIEQRLNTAFPHPHITGVVQILPTLDVNNVCLSVTVNADVLSGQLAEWVARSPLDVYELLKHIRQLEQLLADMQTESIAFREGQKHALRDIQTFMQECGELFTHAGSTVSRIENHIAQQLEELSR